jgi:hypothetical protein
MSDAFTTPQLIADLSALTATVKALVATHPAKPALEHEMRKASELIFSVTSESGEKMQAGEHVLALFDAAMATFYRALRD